jgi:hypothetical protein
MGAALVAKYGDGFAKLPDFQARERIFFKIFVKLNISCLPLQPQNGVS